MSDGAFDVFAETQAVGEHLGQDQDGEAEEKRAADRRGEQAACLVGRQGGEIFGTIDFR